MTNLQFLFDKSAIGLSTLCGIHCLVLPFVLVLFPSLASLGLASEEFHLWMVYAVVPTSIFAFTLGCKEHKRFSLLAIATLGLGFLLSAIFVAGPLLGEWAEKTFTVVGAALMAYGHYRNYMLCRRIESCCCPSS